MISWLIVLALGSIAISAALTGLVRRIALARNLLDIPNERSSHSVPTPRGGGIAIVLSFASALIVASLLGHINGRAAFAILLPGVLVAAIGLADDRWEVKARYRLVVHVLAAVLGLFLFGGPPKLALLGKEFDLGFLGWVLATFYIVWVLNLYNFMDGINGLAAGQAITVCMGGGVLFLLSGDLPGLVISVALGLAALGFLFWNFPVAKIFMGDVGSGFIGITLAMTSLYAAGLNPEFLWAWLILSAIFIVDATVTLISRLAQGEKLHEAHRTHAYQHLAQRAGSHTPVVTGILLINILVLMPLAILSMKGTVPAEVCFLLAYTPLALLSVAVGAGRRGQAQRV